jgi:hypothetical protein
VYDWEAHDDISAGRHVNLHVSRLPSVNGWFCGVDQWPVLRCPPRKDGEITSDRLRLFELPGTYPIYFVSFGLQARFRRTKAYKLLLDSLFDVIRGLATDGIFIDRICANAFSPGGESMCKTFGMRCIQKHSDRGKIYATTLSEVLSLEICRGYTDLIRLYEKAL